MRNGLRLTAAWALCWALPAAKGWSGRTKRVPWPDALVHVHGAATAWVVWPVRAVRAPAGVAAAALALSHVHGLEATHALFHLALHAGLWAFYGSLRTLASF